MVLLITLQCIYFFLPAYFSNMAPVIVKRIPFLTYPLDFGLRIQGKPLLGKNKTFRGLVFGVLFSIIVSYVQFIFYENGILEHLAIVNYEQWFHIGFLLGFGAIFGDMVESFVKRRLDYHPGKPFIPFDQLDFAFGAVVFISFAVELSLSKIIIIFLVSMLLHIAVNHIAFYTKIRKEKW